MTKNALKLLIALAFVALSGCAPYTLVPANNVADLKGFSVTPGKEWSQAAYKPGPKAISWTSSGEVLDQLLFIGDITDGEALLRTHSKDLPMPKYSSTMLPFDIENLVKSSIKNSANGIIEVKTSNLQPAQFGNVPGFRFNISFYTPSGLSKAGDVLGATLDGRLYLIIYTAAELHYYKNRLPEVEKIFSSAIL